jgi:proline iminopeptidase
MSQRKNAFRVMALPRVTLLIGLFLCVPSLSFSQETLGGKSFESAGTRIHFEVIGGGPRSPIVVVNGGPGFNHTYLHLSVAWNELGTRGPVVFYDQRGNGRSQALSAGQTCTLQDNIEDLEALRRHLAYPKIILIGHSWGGYLSMAYAARYPERVEKLVLVGTAGPKWLEIPDRDGQQVYLFEYIFPEIVERRSKLALNVTLGDTQASTEDLSAYLSMLFLSEANRDDFISRCKDCKFDRDVNRLVNQDLQRFDLTAHLDSYGFPTLIITGRYDINVAPLVSYKIHRMIPRSELVFFEKSGHLPFHEEPAKFVEVVTSFLNRR